MKRTIITSAWITVCAGLILSTASCSKKDTPEPNNTTQTPSGIEVKTITSLEATEKIYLNLTTGQEIAAAAITNTNWDISFYAKDRNIVVAVNSGDEGNGNAGAQLVATGFEDLKEAPESGYLTGKEATGDFLKWSNYTGSNEPKHAVLPKPGMTIVIKTADGKYSKLQMISLYKGNPNTGSSEFAELSTRPAFGYFTFRYATQTNGSRNF